MPDAAHSPCAPTGAARAASRSRSPSSRSSSARRRSGRRRRGHRPPRASARRPRPPRRPRSAAQPRRPHYTVKPATRSAASRRRPACRRRAAPGAQPRARPAGARRRPEDQAARVSRPHGCSSRPPCAAARRAPGGRRAGAAPARPLERARRRDRGRRARRRRCCSRSDPGERRAIASTTKLMTALLALERARPRDVFTAPRLQRAPGRVEDRPARRRAHDRADLLEALLLESANDAAVTLAEGVSGSREAFVAEMNARADELGLDDTSYANPIGLDDPLNYSTRARPRRARRAAAAQAALRAHRGHARRRCSSGRATARGRQPQRAGRRATRSSTA